LFNGQKFVYVVCRNHEFCLLEILHIISCLFLFLCYFCYGKRIFKTCGMWL